MKNKHVGPKILFLDIETAPLIANVWGIFEQDVALNQIIKDWHIISWAAKWGHDSRVMQQDQRNAKNVENDKNLLKPIWKLIDEADILVTHNGKRFDIPRLNSRFKVHNMAPPSGYKHIDTLQIARKKFHFTSNKLEHLSNLLCQKHRKLKVKKFQGFELWKECINGNKAAWKEMARYNAVDVLTLEELYNSLIPWDNSINFSLYTENPGKMLCSCGSRKFYQNGHAYTSTGKFKRYKCAACGSEWRSGRNEIPKKARKAVWRRT